MSLRPDEIDLGRRELLALTGAGLGSGVLWNATRGSVSGRVSGPSSRPEADDEDVQAYVRENAGFGLDLLRELAADAPGSNLLVSPVSVSGALAMTWAGARGETEAEMREAIRFPHDQEDLHPTVGALQYDLNQRAADVPAFEVPQVWRTNRFELSVANALWGQQDYPFRESFIETADRYYGGGLRTVDFRGATEASRERVNDWGATATNGRIDEILPPDAIDYHRARIVLTNAVYLLADWERPFDPDDTEEGEFTALDGSTQRVQMMYQKEEFGYVAGHGEGYQAVELPYVGGSMSMVVLLRARRTPDDSSGYESFEAFEAAIDADWLADRFAELDEADDAEIELTMPRFEFEMESQLADPLDELGMSSAFESGRADFDGMVQEDAGVPPLYLMDVFHDTYVAVDEEGTEAAAVSAPVGGAVSGPPIVTVDRPFLFLIRDRETDAVLFLGRVVDADAAQ